jgi:hypothetical protein
MDSIKRNLLKANKCDALSREQFNHESWALGVIKGMVSYWADENDFRGRPMKGHQLVQWKKEVYDRVKELNEIFKEVDEDRKRIREAKK